MQDPIHQPYALCVHWAGQERVHGPKGNTSHVPPQPCACYDLCQQLAVLVWKYAAAFICACTDAAQWFTSLVAVLQLRRSR